MPHTNLRIVLPALIALLAGCTTSQSVRYHMAVANVDTPDPVVKFYRVTVRARSSNVKASLSTGFYDAKSVRQLYGEVKASNGDSSGGGLVRFVYDDKTATWLPASQDELFTIVYGADAKALAAEIKAYADSDLAGEQMGRLLAAAAGGDAYMEAIAEEKLASKQKEALQSAVTKMKEERDAAKKLAENAPADEVGKVLVAGTQELVKLLGSKEVLKGDSGTNRIADAERIYNELSKEKGK